MTSRNLYSKLMKEDLKNRLWAVSLIGLVFFFAFPVVAAFQAGSLKDAVSYEKELLLYTGEMKSWLSFGSGMTVFLMMMVSLICGMSSFSYLNSRSKVDFYHSIPVKREKLFIANYVNGILILAVPYAVALMLAVVIAVSNGVSGSLLWPLALSGYGLNMVYYILMYSLVVVAAMMTGNLVIGVLGSGVLCFYIPAAVVLIGGYMTTFFQSFVYFQYEDVMNSIGRISPVVEYIYQIGRYASDGVSAMSVITAVAASVLLAVLGCILYRIRPSEAAGRAMAFAVSKPVIRILVTILSAMGLGLFFWSMRHTTGWAVFGILCGGIIAHCVIEIIYHFDFKKLFANRMQLVVCLAVSLLGLLAFRYDWTGYDRYLPDADKVKTAAIDISRLNEWVSYGEARLRRDGEYEWTSVGSEEYIFDHMQVGDTRNVLAIAQAGIERLKSGEELWGGTYYYSDRFTEDGVYSTVTICYTLSSGRKVYRRYQVAMKEIMEPAEQLYADGSYKAGAYPVMNLNIADVAEVRYREVGPETRLNQMTTEEKKELLEAFRLDFSKLSIEQMQKEAPVGLIRFVTMTDAQALAWEAREQALAEQTVGYYRYYRGFEEKSYYPVYPSFENTIKILEKYGVEPGNALDGYDIKSADVHYYIRNEEASQDRYYGGSYSEEAKHLVFSDGENLNALKAVVVLERLTNYYNPLYPTENIDISLNTETGKDFYSVNVRLPKGQIPDFLQTKIDERSEKE